MQELRAAQAVTGLAAISGMDQLFERLDIHPALLGLVTYSDELGAVPLDGSQLLLYVRSDVLEAAAAAAGSSSSGGAFRVPDSWEQLLQVAAVTHGLQATQLRVVVNATGGVAYEPTRAPVSGFCFPPSPRVLGDLALAVLASLVQTTGPQQGLYLNTDTLQPATATAAMPYVLSYLRRLAAYAPRAVPSSRAPQFSNDFALGRCAMTIGTAAQFRRNSHAAHPAGPSAVIGRVATALLPGSDVVLSADGQGLVGCTASLCPYSETVSALQPPGSSTSGSSSSAHRRLLATDDGSNATGTGASAQLAAAATSATSSVRVNRSPLLVPEGLAGGLDGEADVMAQLYSWTLLSNFGGPSGSWTLLLHPSAEVGPWRTSHMEAAAVDRWTAAGFEGADTQSFLAAARSCLAHPNNAPPLRIRTALQYTRAVQDAVWTLLDTPPAAAWSAVQEAVHQRGVLQALQDNVGLLYSAATAPVPRTVLLAEYRSSLGLAGSPSGAVYEPEQDSGGQSKSLSAAVAGGIAAAVGTTVLVVLALLVYRVWRRRGLGRRVSSNWRVLEAPSASPDTVLLVTDIEGSTSLWEALPEEVMDRALRVHHITVRTVGRKFYAYESATEGDSFILAFACTANAAQFALELQRALLIAAWPQDLLAVPGCAPVYVRKLDWVAKANQLSLRAGDKAAATAAADNRDGGSRGASDDGGGGRPQQAERQHADTAARGSNADAAAADAVAPSGLSDVPQLPQLPTTLSLRPSDLALAFNFAPQHRVVSTGGVRPRPAEASAAAAGPSSTLSFADVLLHAPVPVSTLGLQPLVPTRGGATTEPLRKGQHVHFQSLQHQSSGGGDEVGQQATAATALEPGKKMPSFGTPFRAAAAAAAGLVQGRRSSRWLPFLHSGGAKGSHTQPSTPSGHAEPAEAPLALGPSSAPDKQTPAAAGPTRAPPQNGQAGLGALRLARTSASHVEAQRIHNNPAFSTPAGINSASGAVATAAASSSAAVALANRFSALAAELGPGEFSVHGGKRLTQHNSLQLQPQQPRGPVLGVRGWSLPRPASRNRTGAGAAGAAGITANANDGPDITPQHAPQQLLRAFSSKRRAPSPAPRSSNTNDQGVIRASHARFSSFTGLVSNNKEPAAAERQQPSSAPWWSWRPSSNKGAQQPEGAGAATAVAHVASSSEDGGVVRDAGTPRATAALKASSSVRWPLSPFLRRQRQHPPPAGSGIASASGHRTGSVSGQAGATAGSDQQRTSLRQSASMGDERVTPTTAAGPAGTSTYSGAGEDTAAGGSAAANAVDSAPISPVASRMGSFLQMLPTRIQSLTLKLRSQLHLQPHQQPLGQRAARPGGNSMLSRCSSNESDARASAGGGRTSRTSVSRANAVYPALASAAVHEDAFQQHEAGSDGPATAVDVQSLAGLSLGSHVGGSSGAATIRRGPSYGEPRIVMETLVEEATQQLAALMSNAPLAGSGGAADGAAGGATPAAPSGLLADGGTHSVPWGEVGAGGQPGGHSPNSRDEEWQRAEEAAARSAATRRSTREAAAFGIIIGGGPDRVLSLTPGMGALLEAIPDPEHRQPLLPAEDFLMGVSVSLAYHAQQSDTRLEAAGGSAERVLTTVPSAAAAAPKTTALGVPVPGSLLELLWRVFPSLPPGVSPRQDQQQQVAHGVAPSETQLVFAGLRVRVGLHCGVTDARDIQYNAATARMTFGGEGLRIVKAVCDCASGGQVVMSGEVLLRLRAASTASGGMIIPQQGQTHVLDLGDHQLLEAVAAAGGTTASRQGQPQRGGADEAAPVSRQLLSLVPATLLGRLSLMPPVRSAIHQYTPGFMDAPVGDSVTVVVFRVAQASALLAWNAQAAADALTLMEIYLRASLGPLVADGLEPEERRVSAGGATQQPVACYLAAAPPGSPFGTFVAGFSQPAAAARWALTAAGRMAELPWPAELLELQLCRPLEEVTRAEAEAVTDVRGADGAASGAATPLRFVLGRGSRHLGAGSSAAADGTAGNSGSRCKLPRIGGARSVPTSPLFAAASLPPAAAAAGPSASTPAGSRAGGVGSSCDGGTPAGTAAGSSFRSNRSGPLFGRALQRSSSSRITPSHAIGRQHSSRGISATGAPPAALGSGGGGGGLGGSRVAHSRSAFGGSPYLEPAAAAARAPYSRSDIGGMRGQQLPMPSPRAMSIRAAIYEGGESAVELMPLDTMESTVDCEHVFEAVEEPNELHHRHQGSSLSTMHERVQRPRPLQEVLTAALGRAPCALASMPSSVHAEITPAADDDGAQAAESTGTMGRLSDAVSCPVAAVTQQRSIPGAETSGALDSMYSGMSGFSRLGTMGRRLDDVTRSHEASGMLRSFAMDDGTVREGAEPAPGSETAGGRGQHPQQRPHPWHTRPRTEHDLPRRASLQQLQPMAPHPRDRPPGSGRGGAHDSKSTVRRLHARMLRTLTTSFSDVGLRRKLAASKSEIAAGAGGSDVGAPFASAVAGESAGGSSSRASGKRLFSPLVSHVAGLASPVYSSSNGGRVGHELTSALMSTGGVAGLDARPFSPPSQGLGSSGANSGFRALQMLVGNRRASQPGGREPSVSGIGAHGSGLIPALATAPSATADAMAAAAARAAEDAEVVSFRGLRVRLGMAVGPVAVQLCPLTGRVVYSGKTVGAAVNVAAAARLGTLYVTQDAAEALSQCGARLVKLPEPEERPRQSKPLLLLPASLTGSPAVSQKPSGTRRRASALSFLLGPRSSVPAVVPLKLAGGASATAAAASQQSTSGAGQQLLRQRTHNTAELERVFLSAAEADAQQQQQQQQRGLGDVPRIAGNVGT
ncbi:hypothetical protein HXX76_006366 [Chlamydomonas incerta]|uniref:Guanylate cyclase domain-containing protein n=1 Tax=Chlamydomonas incerta TaxID=51695 RepID=A0A835T3T5_CHLIN|nr:hypothetical protein HXX76_006366 [Chlamydomonas incerta]|eukprot:KAG2436846.1 hypothetical protein HXX76_006366 [Chlamydomonas incerta]